MLKGVVSVTFRKKSVEEIIDIVKKSGLAAIEWGGDIHVPHGDVATAERVGKLTRAAGIEPISYGTYYECTKEDVPFDDVLASAVALGVKVIRVWAGKKNFDETTEEERKETYAALRYAVDAAAKKGIIVATELHINTLTNTLEGALEMLKQVPGLKTYWQCVKNAPDPEEEYAAIRTLGKNIVGTHIGGSWIDGIKHPLEELGEQVSNYISMLEELETPQYMMIEFVAGDSGEQLIKDAEFLLKA
ncbi:MAG: hypothetical protein E7409_03170 [Ruminococcaceae bacterium]|nr:hypothetical protein [Oscillospiraceae bacterium]